MDLRKMQLTNAKTATPAATTTAATTTATTTKAETQSSFFFNEPPDADTLIVSFAGHDVRYGGTGTFEFFNFLNQFFKGVHRHFYIDRACRCYHTGIEGVSEDVDGTVAFLREKIARYRRVFFIGASSGGYAALLFGSLLRVHKVVAFFPPTILMRIGVYDERYMDLKPWINDATQYCLYGDENVTVADHPHHISHCENIATRPNVVLHRKKGVNMKEMRNNGELFRIMDEAIHSEV